VTSKAELSAILASLTGQRQSIAVSSFNIASILPNAAPSVAVALRTARTTLFTAASGASITLPAPSGSNNALYFRGSAGSTYTLSGAVVTTAASSITVDGTVYAVGDRVTIGGVEYVLASSDSLVLVTNALLRDASDNTVLAGYVGQLTGTLTIPSNVTAIAENAFSGQTGLTAIDFSTATGITSIGNAAFQGCTGLASVIIPDSVSTLGTGVFQGCTSLTQFRTATLWASLTAIPASTFEGCSSLAAVRIPANVQTIGASAFAGCTSLGFLIVPQSDMTIEDNAFAGTSDLRVLYMGAAPTSFSTVGTPLSLSHIALEVNNASWAQSSIVHTTVSSIGSIFSASLTANQLRGAIAGLVGSGSNYVEVTGVNIGALLTTAHAGSAARLSNASGLIYLAQPDGMIDLLDHYFTNGAVFYIPGNAGDMYQTYYGPIVLRSDGVRFGDVNYAIGEILTLGSYSYYVGGVGSAVLIKGPLPLAPISLAISYTSKTDTSITFTVTSTPLPADLSIVGGGYSSSYNSTTGAMTVSGLTASTEYIFMLNTADAAYDGIAAMTSSVTTNADGGGGIQLQTLALNFISKTSSSLTYQVTNSPLPSDLYADGAPITMSGNGTVSLTGLQPETTYTFNITTTDATFVQDPLAILETTRPLAAVPCFLGSARVKMANGSWCRLRDLSVGDKIAGGAVTRVVCKTVTASAAVNPYVIPVGLFGARRRLLISPNHRVAVPGRGLVEARHLGLAQEAMEGAFDYYNVEIAGNGNMNVEGVEVESLAPVRRITMTTDKFVALVKAKYADRPLAEIHQLIRATCRLLPGGRVEAPVMAKQ
jgi:chitodextrinase